MMKRPNSAIRNTLNTASKPLNNKIDQKVQQTQEQNANEQHKPKIGGVGTSSKAIIGSKVSASQQQNTTQINSQSQIQKEEAKSIKQPTIQSKIGFNSRPATSGVSKSNVHQSKEQASQTKANQAIKIQQQELHINPKDLEIEPIQKIQKKIQENTIEEDVRLFKNQRSKLLQWYYANLKLDHSFSQQQTQARDEIFDRFMQLYDQKQQAFELNRLIQNHEKLSIIDDSLNLQYDQLSDISQQYPLFMQNMDYLGQKMERALNHLPIGCDTIIEDSDLMRDQISDIGNQMQRSVQIMSGQQGFTKEIQSKLDELQNIINLECEQLNQLQKLTQNKQRESLSSNSTRIQQIIDEREDHSDILAMSNTFM
eukprot:403351160